MWEPSPPQRHQQLSQDDNEQHPSLHQQQTSAQPPNYYHNHPPPTMDQHHYHNHQQHHHQQQSPTSYHSQPVAAAATTTRVVAGNNNGRGRMQRKYRGIFSSSLCGMFETTRQSRTDACALACCGVWLWERNNYISKRVLPKPWSERKMEFTAIFFFLMWIFVTNIYSKTTDTSENGGEEEDPVFFTFDPSRIIHMLLALSVGAFVYVMKEFSTTRAMLRQEWALDTFQELYGPPPDEAASPEARQQYELQKQQFFHQHHRELQGCAHSLCGFARNDVILSFVPEEDNENHHPFQEEDSEKRADLCAVLWRIVATLCCGCCNCWCQFCGMCAIAQEHRHLQTRRHKLSHSKQQQGPDMGMDRADGIDDPDLWQCDYITMQPWKEYMPPIHRLRQLHEGQWKSHVQALSQLSGRLFRGVQILILVIFVFMVLMTHWMSGWEFLVLLATCLQPTIILYFVYWLWHRFDVSLDAILKYFASGFVICTSMSIVYEVAVSAVTGIIMMVVGFIGGLLMVAEGNVEMDDDTEYNYDTQEYEANPHIELPDSFLLFIAVLSAFLNGFIVASMVEEIAKYLCFWMIEHADIEDAPDATDCEASSSLLLQEEDSTSPDLGGNAFSSSPGSVPASPNKINSSTWVVRPSSYTSRGAAITAAMVAVAVGFACCENLLYVFVYTPPGLAAEIVTLVMRCIFPVHPLCAAIQSIGVCRRELEQRHLPDSQRDGLGRVLFPAWMLHGMFDFILFLIATFVELHEGFGDEQDKTDEQPTYVPSDDDTSYDMWNDLKGSIPSLIVSFIVMCAGWAYYVKEAREQRQRLAELDRMSPNDNHEATTMGGNGDHEPLSMVDPFGFS